MALQITYLQCDALGVRADRVVPETISTEPRLAQRARAMHTVYTPLFHNGVEPRHLGHEVIIGRLMSELSNFLAQAGLVFWVPSELMQRKVQAPSRSLVPDKDQSTDLYNDKM